MFRVTDSGGGVMYTRNGEFQVDKNNFIVNAQGYRLTGYPANAIGANPVELQLPTANVAPKATSTATSVANLDANAKVIYQTTTVVSPPVNGTVTLTAATPPGVTGNYTLHVMPQARSCGTLPPPDGTYGTGTNVITIAGAGTPASVTTGDLTREPGYKDYTAAVTEIGKPFDPKLTNSYTNASPMTVYDSLGNSHQVMQYFVKRPADAAGNSVYEVYYSIDGQAMAPTTQAGGVWGNPTQFTFNKAGMMTSATTVNLTFANPGGATTPANPLNIAINYTGTTQYGSPYAFKGTRTAIPRASSAASASTRTAA